MSELILTETARPTKRAKRSEPGGLRQNSGQVFLTYPKCPLEPKVIWEQIQEKTQILLYLIAQEPHADGTLHAHCYLKLVHKPNHQNTRFWDIILDGKTYHPNYQGCRSPDKVIKYCAKGGNYVSNISAKVIAELIIKDKKARDVYVEAREKAVDSVEEAMKILEHPKTARDLCLHGSQIEKNLRTINKRKRPATFDLASFDIDLVWDRSKTLILWGGTNFGKTSWAKAALPRNLFVRHVDKLRAYASGEYDGIIFDDMSFKHWPRDAQIHLTDVGDESHINIKHGMAELPAGTPRIITTNLPPDQVVLIDDPAIRRRVQVFHVTKSLVRGAPCSTEQDTPFGTLNFDEMDWDDASMSWVSRSGAG